MTKLLKEAIEQLRDLPEEDQDAAADALFAFISSEEREYVLRPEQVVEVYRIRDGLRSGATHLATAEEIGAIRDKSRL